MLRVRQPTHKARILIDSTRWVSRGIQDRHRRVGVSRSLRQACATVLVAVWFQAPTRSTLLLHTQFTVHLKHGATPETTTSITWRLEATTTIMSTSKISPALVPRVCKTSLFNPHTQIGRSDQFMNLLRVLITDDPTRHSRRGGTEKAFWQHKIQQRDIVSIQATTSKLTQFCSARAWPTMRS